MQDTEVMATATADTETTSLPLGRNVNALGSESFATRLVDRVFMGGLKQQKVTKTALADHHTRVNLLLQGELSEKQFKEAVAAEYANKNPGSVVTFSPEAVHVRAEPLTREVDRQSVSHEATSFATFGRVINSKPAINDQDLLRALAAGATPMKDGGRHSSELGDYPGDDQAEKARKLAEIRAGITALFANVGSGWSYVTNSLRTLNPLHPPSPPSPAKHHPRGCCCGGAEQ